MNNLEEEEEEKTPVVAETLEQTLDSKIQNEMQARYMTLPSDQQEDVNAIIKVIIKVNMELLGSWSLWAEVKKKWTETTEVNTASLSLWHYG